MPLLGKKNKKRLMDFFTAVDDKPSGKTKKKKTPRNAMSYFESGKNKKKRYDKLAGIEED